MPYIFKKVPDDPASNRFDSIAVEMATAHNEQSLSDLVSMFQDFLKGCGYIFDGDLDIVDEEETYE